MNKCVFIIAGEVSGDMFGASLVSKILAINPKINFYGLGGNKMRQAGVDLIEHTDKLSVMGTFEVLRKIFFFKKLLKKTIKQIDKYSPKAIILIDYPGFNLRLAKKIKKKSIPIFYYIPPKVWAWKKRRINDIQKYIDEVFYIFPFEDKIYKKKNLKSEYVGNPLVELISSIKENTDDSISWNKQKRVALLPGSRSQEIKYILPIFLSFVNNYDNDTSFVIAAANECICDEIRIYLDNFPKKIENVSLVTFKTLSVLKQADAAIITSGTATLEAALLNTPHLLIYKGSWLTSFVAKVFVNLKYYGLVNLLLDREVSVEIIQKEISIERLRNELDKLFEDKFTSKMKNDFLLIKHLLGSKKSSEIVAKKIMNIISSN